MPSSKVGRRTSRAGEALSLTPDASADLGEIREYYDNLPAQHVEPIMSGLQALLYDVASHPPRGTIHSSATRMLGEEVRTRALPPYRIFYRDRGGLAEVIAVLHTARDVNSILSSRLQ